MSDGAERAREFSAALADDLLRVAPDALVSVYLHGSAVLGDWIPDVSDIDVLVVATDASSPAVVERLAATLAAERDCPGIGLEASVVEARAAAVPVAPWPFVVHVTTAPSDRKAVFGNSHPGDPDLILHYTVTRESGWPAYGPPPEKVIGEVAHDTVVGQLARELRWAVQHATESYAVLNACRALRYCEEHVLSSKSDGGTWALARDIEPALVQRALDARRGGRAGPISETAAAWVVAVADVLKP